jgi:lipopolysaccharide biosynthesis glycosyltransferase
LDLAKALITVNYGNFLKLNARRSMEAAANRWGVEFFEFSEDTLPKWLDRAPNAMKTTVFYTTDYDEVMIVDADVIISSHCPNPFDAFPDAKQFVAVMDQSPHSCQASSWQKHITKRPELNQPLNHNRYFNSGVMLARRSSHEAMFNRACEICREDFGCSWSDQTPLNLAALLENVRVNLVDERWNYLAVQRFANFMEIGSHPEGPYILHGAGDPSRERWLNEVRW